MNSPDDEDHWIKEYLDWMVEYRKRSRQYSSYWEDPFDRRQGEVHVAKVLMNSFEKSSGYFFKYIDLGEDPPDVRVVMKNGMIFGIEVTEVVDGEKIKKYRHQNSENSVCEYIGVADWSLRDFVNKLQKEIIGKDGKLRHAKIKYKKIILILYTDECTIHDQLIEEAIPLIECHPSNIDEIYFVHSYHPAADKGRFPDQCPIWRIY